MTFDTLRARTPIALTLLFAAAACSSNSGGGGTGNPPTCTGSTITVPVDQVMTVSQADAPCVQFAADGSTYMIVPQFATGDQNLSTAQIGYEMGTFATGSADIVPYRPGEPSVPKWSLSPTPHGIRQKFDFALREKERALARTARPQAQAQLPPGVARGGGPPSVGDTGVFWVCGDLNCDTFKRDTSIVKFVGTKIAIFLSKNSPANGFDSLDIDSLGKTFDKDLYPIDVNTFGAPSDIDGNGLVFVLMTPKVNAMTTPAECASQGFIAGFFFGNDLIPGNPNSNDAEIFYSIVPDPTGSLSCAHSVAFVKSLVLATFIHEFQHMISWNQHVIVRGGPSEETWLNEGMSHIAEEMGSRYYEHKFPPPSGRTNPAQLFPDSSEGFISGDLGNSYSYLTNSGATSVTLFANSGSLEERGAAWLFLRWLGDLKDSTIYGKLDQTILTGVANVESQSGEGFTHLFGDFTMAIYTDSLPGLPRNTAPARDRYVSRNLRQIYNRLFQTSSEPAPWPFTNITLPIGSRQSSSMIVGTMEFWKLTMPSSGSSQQLIFTSSSNGSFSGSDSAQVSIFHCPSAAACP
jgi:hypothetical protein